MQNQTRPLQYCSALPSSDGQSRHLNSQLRAQLLDIPHNNGFAPYLDCLTKRRIVSLPINTREFSVEAVKSSAVRY
jgi:hypothetical protein